MSALEILAWLRELGLQRYERMFLEHEVDAVILPKLTAEDLKDLGITAVGHRRKLLEAIAALAEQAQIENESQAQSAESVSKAKATEAERRQLTVMFIDLVDSTKLSTRLDPEDLGQIIRVYQESCTKVIDRWGGHIANYMGDGVLVYFGYPKAREDDVERAVYAGLEVTDAIPKLTPKAGVSLEARVGIATGLVMVGDLTGEGTDHDGTVVGETPNLAARLQGIGNPGKIVVAPETRRLSRGVFSLIDLGEQTLKGFSAPVRAWEVVGEVSTTTRFEAARRRSVTPLVGRDDQMELIARRWERAKAGDGQVVLISGDPGIGKSRLCTTFCQRFMGDAGISLAYQCSAHHGDAAFHPVIRQLEHASGIQSEHDPNEKLRRLKVLLRPTHAKFEEDIALLGKLLSITPEADDAVTVSSTTALQDEICRALFEQLESLALDKALLVQFEDLHWADPSTLDLLACLVERIAALPILILLTTRPGFAASWTDQAHVTLLTLNRISNRESRDLIGALAGSVSLPDTVSAEIIAKGDGIPLFIEELIHSVLETHTSDNVDDIVTSSWEVPASLKDSLMARLDRLRGAKTVAQRAAILGREFTTDMLKLMTDLTVSDLKSALDELVETGILHQKNVTPDGGYIFNHALVQEAAYSSLLISTRRELHRRAAEKLSESWAAAEPAMLAYHWENAGDLERAVACRLEAGERSAAGAAPWQGIAQYWHALGLLQQLPQSDSTDRQFLEALVAFTNTVFKTGISSWQTFTDQSLVELYIDKAINLAEANKNYSVLARLEAIKGNHWLNTEMFSNALKHARLANDPELLAEVEGQIAGRLGKVGKFDEAIAHANRAIEIYASIGAELRQAYTMAGVGRCYCARTGRIEDSLLFASRARKIAQATNDAGLKSMLAMEAEPLFYRGLWQQTVELVEQDLGAAQTFGNWSIVLWCSAWSALAELKLGRTAAARSRIEDAMSTAGSKVGETFPLPYALVALAQVRLADGQFEAALSEANRASELSQEAQLMLEQGAAHRTIGLIHEARGDSVEAEAEFRRSFNILNGIESRPELAQSMLAYGRFKLREDVKEGQRLLKAALSLFEEINAFGWVRETKATIDTEEALADPSSK
ncbi:MAG: AAA family ATPase [Pseudomonadota bacterium]